MRIFSNDPTSIAPLKLVAVGANGNSPDLLNSYGKGIKLAINLTASAGTSPTLTVTIQGKDPTSSGYYTILASAALSAFALTTLTVYPGITATANVSASDVLPATWRVAYTIGGSGGPTITATISAQLIA